MAKLPFVICAIWNWPQEPLLNILIPVASEFWGPRKLISSFLADSDTGIQYGLVWQMVYRLRNNSHVCEIDSQLYTVLNKHSLQEQPFFLMHLRKTSVNCDWISSMMQGAVETRPHITNFLGFVLSLNLSTQASFPGGENTYLPQDLQLHQCIAQINRSGSADEKSGAKHLKLKLHRWRKGCLFLNKTPIMDAVVAPAWSL